MIKKLLSKLIIKSRNILFKALFLEVPLPKHPFGKEIYANKKKYSELFNNAIKSENILIEEFENVYGFKVEKEWFNNLALHTQTCIKKKDLNFSHGRLLYTVLSKYLQTVDSSYNNSINILETGTARGFSAICMSRALIDNKKFGHLITIDCISHNEKMIWNCIDDLEGPKTRYELLKPWKEEISNITFLQGWTETTIYKIGKDRINFAFLDAQHTKKNVMLEFKFISKRQKKGDIVFFDDVTPGFFDGVCEAVDEIEKNYPYSVERLKFSKERSYALAKRLIN